jgi:hypothetical protein
MATISKKTFVLVGVVSVTGVVLTACAQGTKISSPDPTSQDIKVNTVKGVVGMPQGFRNVALGCDAYGDMIFVTSRGSDIAGGPNGGGLGSGVFVVPNHKACVK